MKDLYHAFIANKMVNYRAHWDNLSDDVCYIDPDPAIFNHLDEKMKRRQKKPSEMNRIEREAHKSVAHCSRVCEYEGLPVDYPENGVEEPQEWAQQHGLVGDQDTSPSSQILEPRDTSTSPPKPRMHPLNRRCFQYRYHNGVCCTSRSFKLGAPHRDAKANMPDKPENVWHSGWYLQGINDWIAAKGECREPKWKVPDKL